MKSTENYGLNKPEVTDIYNINDFNDNMDIIDTKLKEIEENAGSSSTEALNEHLKDTDNPHNVTAEQVGLGNVDNTSDKDKPVSDAVQAEIDKLKQAIIDVDAMNEVSGSPILLTDTASGVLEDFNAKGRSTQTQTKGCQLFDASKLTTTSGGGATVTNNGDGSFTISGSGAVTETVSTMIYKVSTDDFLKLFKAGRLYLKTEKSTTPDLYVNLYKDGAFVTTLLVTRNGTSISVELLEEYFDGTYSLTIGFSWIQVGATIASGTIKPMLYQDGDGTWEEFSGGTASPNPTYPQAIKSNGDMGYFDGELLGGIYTNGVFGSITNYVCSKNQIPCQPNDKIEVTYDGACNVVYAFFYDENGAYLSHKDVASNKLTTQAIANAHSFHIGVYNANGLTVATAKHICVTINDKYALIVDSKGKNELENTATTKTTSGVTFTVNEDKSISVSGTATALANFKITSITLPKGSYILNGCPSGGSSNSYRQYLLIDGASIGNDDGNGLSFELTETKTVEYRCRIASGYTVNNLTFYPMIRPLGTDDTYEPYIHSRKYIPISAPLRGLGEVTDVASLSECKVDRKYTKLVFDGSSDESWSLKAIGCELYLNNTNSGNTLCTHYKKNNGVSWGDLQDNEFNIIGTVLRIKDNTHQSTLDEWKAWLQANPITVIYESAEPTTESIEPVDVDTFEGVTQISCSDDADMWVQYYSNSNVGQRLAKTNAELDKMNEHIITSEEAINKLESFAVETSFDIEEMKESLTPGLIEITDTENPYVISEGSTGGGTSTPTCEMLDYEYLTIEITHRDYSTQIVQMPSVLLSDGAMYSFPFCDKGTMIGAYIYIAPSQSYYSISLYGTAPANITIRLYKYGKPIPVG